jgi:hypothetical protein
MFSLDNFKKYLDGEKSSRNVRLRDSSLVGGLLELQQPTRCGSSVRKSPAGKRHLAAPNAGGAWYATLLPHLQQEIDAILNPKPNTLHLHV